MADITASSIKSLREKSGAGMVDCKNALIEADGNEEKAVEILRKKGMATAIKKSGRVASEGAVGSYIHMGGKVGVLVEINCESDFVSRGDEFQQLVKDVAMHIAAVDPKYAHRSEVSTEDLEKEPADVIDKIIEGRINKFYEENVLVDQPFVKDPSKTIGDLVTEKIASIKENITIRRFTRYKMGEGIEKKVDDFAEEVASLASGN
jgi:elongation factor Ts